MFEEMSLLEKRCWREAIGLFVSNIEDSGEGEDPYMIAWENLLASAEEGEDSEVCIWQPFENWPLNDLVNQIEDTATNLIQMAQELVDDALANS